MSLEAEKVCTKCGHKFPHTSEYFPVRKRAKSGLDMPCRKCCRKAEKVRRSNPVVREKNRRSFQQWHANHPKYNSKRTRLLKFGMTHEDYEALVKRHGGVCAICGQPETAKIRGKLKDLAVDHDHKSGKVRGILCQKHNMGLGCFGDDVEMLKKLIAYIEAGGV